MIQANGQVQYRNCKIGFGYIVNKRTAYSRIGPISTGYDIQLSCYYETKDKECIEGIWIIRSSRKDNNINNNKKERNMVK